MQKTKTLIAAAVALAFLATGCAAETPKPLATAEATSTASATAGRVPATIEAVTPGAAPAAAAAPTAKETIYHDEGPPAFSGPVIPEKTYIKAGESMRVTGKDWEANSPLQVRLSTSGGAPVYNEADDIWHIPDPIILMDLVPLTADADGRIDFQLSIPATVADQTASLAIMTPSGTLEGTRQANQVLITIGERGGK